MYGPLRNVTAILGEIEKTETSPEERQKT